MNLKKSLVISLLVVTVCANHALNYKLFEAADLNKDRKLSGGQFLEASIKAFQNSVRLT